LNIQSGQPAIDHIVTSLRAGKHVVTTNKGPIAHNYEALKKIAEENGKAFLFEGTVMDGTPIFNLVRETMMGCEITGVRGIFNGTTNYILTRMIRAGCSLEIALKEAQENGYAERDPSADIEGHDACRKICILASIAFGRHILPGQVPTEGIKNVTLADIGYADSCGKKIKLLGRAIRREDGKVCAYVAPHLVDGSNPLAGVEDVFNAITVKGDAIGDVMFYGRGAGKLPTASAVVADVMDIARSAKGSKPMAWLPGGDDVAAPPDDLVNRWYVRANASAAQARVLLESVAFLGRAGAPAGETAFLTAPMTRAEMNKTLKDMDISSVIRVLD
jgi:homoserine dehydrogenase